MRPSFVSSRCPLLAQEEAVGFLPSVHMPVPRDSAWVPMQVDLYGFLSHNGDIDLPALEQAVASAVDNGDALHDVTEWREPLIEYDSWLNRRLAIVIRGWGDIVAARGADPRALATLRDMEQLAEHVCLSAHTRSMQLAISDEWCPALDEAGAEVLHKRQSHDWNLRWREAVAAVAVRHRNLTTMSPWDVFPRGKRADLSYQDLLPLMRFADSLSFQCDVSISHWNANEFKGFRRRAEAVLQCNSGAGFVAKQV
ncbi:MAG: hypothetical protein K0U72_11585 [Gammaproteobacteria bacterium]|nr:hypothetical protein [Gammaproteobacteria bacterium]